MKIFLSNTSHSLIVNQHIHLRIVLYLQKLGESVDLKVHDICSELQAEVGVKFSAEVVATISSLAWDKVKRSAEDLESFAGHAKRSNIWADDVKLLTRRNPKLVRNNQVKSFLDIKNLSFREPTCHHCSARLLLNPNNM